MQNSNRGTYFVWEPTGTKHCTLLFVQACAFGTPITFCVVTKSQWTVRVVNSSNPKDQSPAFVYILQKVPKFLFCMINWHFLILILTGKDNLITFPQWTVLYFEVNLLLKIPSLRLLFYYYSISWKTSEPGVYIFQKLQISSLPIVPHR